MRLVSVTVLNYRSITNAYKIRIGQQTVLAGPNNEGKSNILRALVVAMRAVKRIGFDAPAAANPQAFRAMAQEFHAWERSYNWERDYPVHLQLPRPDGTSRITLEFELSAQEVADFKRLIGSDLNGTLPLRISLGPDNRPQINVAKKGPGAKTLTAKSRQISSFVSERMELEHIPAVRTAKSAQEIVSEMVERELETLEADPRYKAALEAVGKIQKPLLDSLAYKLKETLKKFLPVVNDVKVQIPLEDRYRALRRSCQITVDDGTPTLLQHKGDGIQSLAALGIMQHASEKTAKERSRVIAIEEPESHLHPGAMRALRGVLEELSKHHQVVLSTHNPLFIDRSHIENNIVVRRKKARPAKSIQELRELLGVRASDNLKHAEVVLLVEGEHDRISLRALIESRSDLCERSFQQNVLAIDSLGGGTNLAYKAGLFRDALCQVHCFLDDDVSGRAGFEKARTNGILIDADVNWPKCAGMRESEIEDLYAEDLYREALKTRFGVLLDNPLPKRMKSSKWSVRMRHLFETQGKQWDDRIENELKKLLSDGASAAPLKALKKAALPSFQGLVHSLERRLPKSNPS